MLPQTLGANADLASLRHLCAPFGQLLPSMQAHKHATSCTILCTVSEAAHAALPSTMLGESAYMEYLAALKEASLPADAHHQLHFTIILHQSS